MMCLILLQCETSKFLENWVHTCSKDFTIRQMLFSTVHSYSSYKCCFVRRACYFTKLLREMSL